MRFTARARTRRPALPRGGGRRLRVALRSQSADRSPRLAARAALVLAAGTAGFGRERDRVIDLDLLGGIVTMAATPEPRQGHPALRVAEFRGGMRNAVGLAKQRVERVAAHELPGLARGLQRGEA